MPLKFTPNSANLTAALRFSSNPAARMAGVGLVEATQAEAEAGTILHRYMSPLRTSQYAQAQWQGTNHAVQVGKGSGAGFSSVSPGTSGVPLVSNGASSDPSFNTAYAIRERITATRTYFVSKTGSDSNTGLTSGSATAVTFTNGSSNISWPSHGLSVGNNFFLATSGSVPTNFDTTSLYYVKTVVNANTIVASLTSGGSAISAASAGSGSHTATLVSPFLTIQTGIVAIARLDHNGQSSVLQLAGGTYAENIATLGYLGRGTQGHNTPSVQGSPTDKTVVKIAPASGIPLLAVSTSFCEWTFKNLEIDATAAVAAYADAAGWICLDGVTFGGTPTVEMQAADFGIVEIVGNITGASTAGISIAAINEGLFFRVTGTLTLNGTYSSAVAYADSGGIIIGFTAGSFAGSTTGKKYIRTNGGIFNLSGSAPSSVFPGTIAGTESAPIDGRSIHGDSDYTILNTDLPLLQVSAVLTSPRTWTLPAANSVAAGAELCIQDTGGISTTNTLTIQRGGSDTFVGPGVSSNAITLNSQFGSLNVRSDGSGEWNLMCVASAAPQTQTALSIGVLVFRISGVDFNSANTDNAITITLPTGTSRYRISLVHISGASASLTTATFGVFTSTGGGGTAVVASGTACTVSTASENTANNMQIPAVVNQNTASYNAGTLYFRVQTPQGSAATAKVTIAVNVLS